MTSSMPNPYLDEQGRTDAELYLTDIYDGKIVASKWMRKLADMMLPRFHEEYHGYHFAVDRALRVVRFIEEFTVFPEGSKMGQPFKMERFQRSAVELAYGFVDENGLREFRQVLFEVARKNGKALDISTEIPTPSGWRRMADIHVGDHVFGQDGRPSLVVAESDIFDKDTYRVTFEDGSHIDASGDHVWTIRDPFDGVLRDRTTVEVMGDIELWGSVDVPLPKPVEYPHASLENDPYETGVACAASGTVIPSEYLTADVRQREALFDGIVGALGRRRRLEDMELVEVLSTNRELLGQIEELASSLGVPWYVDEELPHSMVIRMDDHPYKAVVSVRRVPNVPTKCIAIDNQSHLYLAGRQYTATHNTSLMAALCLYHLTSDGELGAEVYNCAKNEQQARKCYGSADAMRLKSPFLKDRIRRGTSQKSGTSALNYDKTGSVLRALSGKASTKDGLSASAVIYDELASVEDNGALFEQLEESTGSRRQPMTWIISSENNITIDGIWDERLKYCQGILNGTINDDTVLPLLYVQDDKREVMEGLEDDEHKLWFKSNPGLFVIKDVDKLVQRANQASQSPRRLPSLLTKDFCLKSGLYSAFLDVDACINTTPIDFDEIGIPTYVCVGFDLATRHDLCSCVVRWKVNGDDRIYELAKFWVASEMIRLGTDDNQKDNVPYNLWSSSGQPMDGTIWHWVDVVEGDRVGMAPVFDFLNDLVSVGMYPYCAAYDPWRVGDLEDKSLRRLIGDSRCFAVPQTARVISPLMREHELDLKAHRIICPNPCLHHHRASVQARIDNNDNIYPQKKDLKPNMRIDGFMAELFSLAGYNRYRDEYLAAIGWEPPVSS